MNTNANTWRTFQRIIDTQDDGGKETESISTQNFAKKRPDLPGIWLPELVRDSTIRICINWLASGHGGRSETVLVHPG